MRRLQALMPREVREVLAARDGKRASETWEHLGQCDALQAQLSQHNQKPQVVQQVRFLLAKLETLVGALGVQQAAKQQGAFPPVSLAPSRICRGGR